jgi:thiamine pyrophosphate-dependent acetolactate synthase large subunit-like protein
MGFGLPSAIGAKVAAPHKTVIDIDGDASFSMTAMELATAKQFNIGVKVLVLNNEFQGMVEQWQGSSSPPIWSLSHSFTHVLYRFVLRSEVLAYPNAKPRLCETRPGDGCTQHPLHVH